MKSIYIWLLKFASFWLLVFYFYQTIFLLFNSYLFKDESATTILNSYIVSFQLHFSTICYFAIIPTFLLMINFFSSNPFFKQILRGYIVLLLVLFGAICLIEIPIYKEWGTKLNYKAIRYFKNPKEIIQTASIEFLFLFFIALGSFTFLGIKIFIRIFEQKLDSNPRFSFKKICFALLYLPSMGFIISIGLRGGFQEIPINQSSSYYCSNNTLNVASVNSIWNLTHSWLKNKKSNVSKFMITLPKNEANSIFHELQSKQNQKPIIISDQTNPNIVLIILEGVSASVINSCGGDSGIMPHFDELRKKGLLFTNCIASGMRSEQGMIALFSGQPALPYHSIIEQPDKFSKMPSIIPLLKKSGYQTSYFFGGQLSYGNIKSYLQFNGTDQIYDIDNIPDFPSGKLGVHDEYMFPFVLEKAKKFKTPFFTTLFTSSTHVPYDIPVTINKHWNNEWDDYLQACYYTDSCLNNFIEGAKKESWYKNTIFIIISDHGHQTHRLVNYCYPDHHKVPWLIVGEPLKEEFKGIQNNSIVSQTDFANTLLTQLHISTKDFKWSRNALNLNQNQFAYYSFDNGYGWQTPENTLAIEFHLNKFHIKNITDSVVFPKQLKQSKAYLQNLYKEYEAY